MEYFRVNQIVYHPIYGEGQVIKISEHIDYPIKVRFKQRDTCFTKDGRLVKTAPITLSQNPIPEIVNKPLEDEYEPFTFEDRELLRNKWIKTKIPGKLTKREEFLINTIFTHGVIGGLEHLDYTYLLNHFTFLDGTPCGKKV